MAIRKIISITFLLGLLSPFHSNAAQRNSPTKTKKSSAITLPRLIEQTLATGQASDYPIAFARLVDLSGAPKARLIQLSSANAADQMSHNFAVIVESSSDSLKPLILILDNKLRAEDGTTEVYTFSAGIDGILKKVIRIDGRHDAEGKAIKGSGLISYPDISAPDVKERFQHELDLWLKGSYRKGSAQKSK